MANSPSEVWVDGVLVERAIETNRWRVDQYGNTIGEDEVVEPKATKPYKPPTVKRVAAAENKAVTVSETKRKR